MIAMADEASDLRGLPAGTAHCQLSDVVSYRSGDLSPERAGDIEEHVRSCAACRRLLRDATTVLRGVDLTVRAASSRFDVDHSLARLRDRATHRTRRPESRPRQPSTRFWLPMVGVATVVVLVAVLQLLMVLLPRRWARTSAVPQAAPAALGPAHTP
jgi:anti-sigma factor RsiW